MTGRWLSSGRSSRSSLSTGSRFEDQISLMMSATLSQTWISAEADTHKSLVMDLEQERAASCVLDHTDQGTTHLVDRHEIQQENQHLAHLLHQSEQRAESLVVAGLVRSASSHTARPKWHPLRSKRRRLH